MNPSRLRFGGRTVEPMWDVLRLAATGGRPPPLATETVTVGRSEAMVDWSKMTPREVWTALKSAPKVAGPWRKGERFLSERPDAFGGIAVGITYSTSRESADDALRAAGWLLVDDAPAGDNGKETKT